VQDPSGSGGVIIDPVTPTAHEFFREVKLVSRFKIRLVTDYVRPFFYKLGSWNYTVWVVDAFAGAGAYDPDETGQREDGSPRALAKLARHLKIERDQPRRRRRRSRLRTINVEADAELFVELERNLAPYRDIATNLFGPFEEHLPTVLGMLGAAPALFYLDPFGVRGIEMEVIARILARKGRTELLIHFSDRSFRRMAGHVIERERSQVGRRAAVSKIEELDRVMGTRKWRAIWQDESLSTDERMDRIVELYRDQLRKRGIGLVHDIRMRDELDDSPRYRLVFATRSDHGTELMSDLACRYHRELEESAHDGSFALEWDRIEREEARVALREELKAYGASHSPISQDELVRAFAPRAFGRFRKSDYAKCLRELVAAGAIKRESAKGIRHDEPLTFEPDYQPPLLDTRLTG
jgi:three-Cys-motif partner protein